MKTPKPLKILLTAGRSPIALDLARQLHAGGHRIFIAETTGLHVSRFSNAVKKSFVVPSPRLSPQLFINTLIDIVKTEHIDLIIPVYEEILYLAHAQHLFPPSCRLFSPPFETLHQLHNKWLFCALMKKMGIEAPNTFLIRTVNDLSAIDFTTPYALKACYSRGSLNLKKIDPLLPTIPNVNIEPHNPWIAQEWLVGDKFCTYTICYEGKIRAHATYPVSYSIEGNSCLTFKAVEHLKILQWVENFVKILNFTGQIAFDFIEESTSKLYAIECNPRATSGVHLFNANDRIDKAFLNVTEKPIHPTTGSSKQIAMGMLMYGWKKSAITNNSLPKFLRTLFSIQDVMFSYKDLKPFLAEPLVFASIWFNSKRKHLSIPASFTYDYEWNGEKQPPEAGAGDEHDDRSRIKKKDRQDMKESALDIF